MTAQNTKTGRVFTKNAVTDALRFLRAFFMLLIPVAAGIQSSNGQIPTVETGMPGLFSGSSVTVYGGVGTNALPTPVYWELGTSSEYGTVLFGSIFCAPGTPTCGAQVTLTDLLPNTTYHYRLVASNSVGVAFGGDQEFTTSSVEDWVFTYVIDGFAHQPSTNNHMIAVISYLGTNGTVTIPAALSGMPVTTIIPSAFYGLSGFTNVTIPDTVTWIGGNAFYSCDGLATVTIGNSITNIGGGAFSACSNLAAAYFRGNAPNAGQVFDDSATVYYLPGTSGWGAMFGSRPTKLWNPQVQTGDSSFGVRQNHFGFNISGTVDIPVLIEASTGVSLGSWTPLRSCRLTNGLIYFSEEQWTNYPSRVYRIRSP